MAKWVMKWFVAGFVFQTGVENYKNHSESINSVIKNYYNKYKKRIKKKMVEYCSNDFVDNNRNKR